MHISSQPTKCHKMNLICTFSCIACVSGKTVSHSKRGLHEAQCLVFLGMCSQVHVNYVFKYCKVTNIVD